jgi:hypothetical protein
MQENSRTRFLTFESGPDYLCDSVWRSAREEGSPSRSEFRCHCRGELLLPLRRAALRASGGGLNRDKLPHGTADRVERARDRRKSARPGEWYPMVATLYTPLYVRVPANGSVKICATMLPHDLRNELGKTRCSFSAGGKQWVAKYGIARAM